MFLGGQELYFAFLTKVVRSYLGHNCAFKQFQYLNKTDFTILMENTASIKQKGTKNLLRDQTD